MTNAVTMYGASNESVVVYQSEDGTLKLNVQLKEESVWLTQEQIATLFGTQRPAITKHLNNIFNSGELDRTSTCSILEHMGNDGKQRYSTKYYNLDVILAVGYRVNSRNATFFRRWATNVLKEYLLRGYVINQRLITIEENVNQRFALIEHTLSEHQEKIDFFVRTSLPPHQGIFYDGQIFDAYTFINDRIREATTRIILIDNYIDDSVLTILSKRADKVAATIYTKKPTAQLQLDIQKHNAQYSPIDIITFDRSHDRFLCIDDTVYHLGASIKDLGKKWFAFNRMEMPTTELLQKIQTTYKTPPS